MESRVVEVQVRWGQGGGGGLGMMGSRVVGGQGVVVMMS